MAKKQKQTAETGKYSTRAYNSLSGGRLHPCCASTAFAESPVCFREKGLQGRNSRSKEVIFKHQR